MMLAATYNPGIDPEPRVHCVIRSPRKWRIEVTWTVDGEDEAVIIRVEDKMRLADVHELAVSEVRKRIPEGARVTAAEMKFWASQ
jgi:hypothetical protein